MNKLQRLYLQLILVALSATQVFSTSRSNISQSLRPFQAERMLVRTASISCLKMPCEMKKPIQLPADDAILSIFMGNHTFFNFTMVPYNGEGLEVSINWDSTKDLSLLMKSGTFVRPFISLQINPVATVSGPMGNLIIELTNNDDEDTIVTITFIRVSKDSGLISNWINPTAGTVGALLALAIIAMWCHRRRSNRQRRNTLQRRQIYQPVEPGSQPPSQPPSPRRAGNPEQEPQQQQRQQQQPSIEEIIDTRFAEANFKQFKSSFPQKTCTICLEDMQEEQPCRQLDCEHIFHSECGKLWLENQFQKMKKAFCPNCNQQVKMKMILKKKKSNK